MSAVEIEDLVDDRALGLITRGRRVTPGDDSLGHSGIAKQICDIAQLSNGQENIAVFAPWGAGKSSLFALIAQELDDRSKLKNSTHSVAVVFDASTTAGNDFSVNFLSEVSRQIGPGTARRTQRKLFQSTRSLEVPFGPQSLPRGWRLVILLIIALVILVGLPFLYTGVSANWTLEEGWTSGWLKNILGWFAYAVSGTVVIALVTFASDFLQVSIEEATPNHFTQFRQIFDSMVSGRKRYIIFIDELDRCSPDALLSTLEGLRSFLGHDNCIFVAAFDRDAVATTISDRSRSRVEKSDPSGRQTPEPYYRTAGEYLDKIFQYQLSLPPQDSRTFRRYAYSLVENRGGIWRSIKESSYFSLDDTIALLSPAHVVSARRIKVLLNDFALSCREYDEILGDSWVSRVDEIAVHSVIETEFPALARDMLIEPDLPRYVVDNTAVPRRDALRLLVASYRNGSIDLDTTSTVDPAEGSALRKEMHSDLTAYLTRAMTIGARLPRPDITRRVSSPLVSAFEDAGLFLALVRAADDPVSDTVAALATASEPDFSAALAYLDTQIEKETLRSESRTLAAVLGELADARPSHPAFSRALRTAWNTVTRGSTDLSWASTKVTKGLASGAVRAGTLKESLDVVEFLVAQQLAEGEVLAALVKSVPTSHWAAFVERISLPLISSLKTDAEPLVAAFVREDLERVGWLDNTLTQMVIDQMEVEDPDEIQPEAPTSTAILAARAANIAAAAETEELRSLLRESVAQLLAASTSVEAGGHAARWLIELAAVLAPNYEFADEALSAAIEKAANTSTRSVLVLSALAVSPAHVAGIYHDLAKQPDQALANRALTSLFATLADATNPAIRGRLVRSIEDVAGLARPGADFDWTDVDKGLLGITTIASAGGSAREGVQILGALRSAALPQADIDRRAVEYFARLPSTAALQEELVPLLQELRAQPREIRDSVQTRLIVRAGEASGIELTMLTLVLTSLAHTQITEGRIPNRPSVALVRRALAAAVDGQLRDAWLRLGPTFRDVKRTLSATRIVEVQPPVWLEYAKNSGQASRDAAWDYLNARTKIWSKLAAIAAYGVDKSRYETLGGKVSIGTVPERFDAASRFVQSLPQGTTLTAGQVVSVAQQLAVDRRVGDLAAFETVVRPNIAAFSSSQRQSIRTALSAWPVVMNPKMIRLKLRLNADLG